MVVKPYTCHYCKWPTSMHPHDADGTGTTGRVWPSCCVDCIDRWETVAVGESLSSPGEYEIPPDARTCEATNQAFYTIARARNQPLP